MNIKRLPPALWLSLLTFSLPLISFVPSATVAESTLGICETNRNIIRIYRQNGQVRMRALERPSNRTWLDTAAAPANRPQVIEYRNIRGEQTVTVVFYRYSPRNCYLRIGSRTENGRVVTGVPGGGQTVPPAVAERACLRRSQQLGYRIVQQSAAQPFTGGYTMALKGIFNGQQIPLKCTYINDTGSVTIDQIPASDLGGRTFNGIPNYGTVRALAAEYRDVPAQKRRYFRVEFGNGSSTTWYANCRTQDHIYDSRSIYLGYSPNARAMLSYVCSLETFPIPPIPLQ